MSDSDSSYDIQEILACPGLYQEITNVSKHVYNKSALINTLSSIRKNLPWVERLDVTCTAAPAPKDLDVDDLQCIDPDDDFKRENYFYRIAQAAVLKAIPQLHALDVPTKRPSDYFAEMVKTDDHMTKVKKYLIETKQKLALRERARQIRERRKFGKQVQQAVSQARKEEKRKLTEAVKSTWKKTGSNREEKLEQILNEFKQDYEPKNENSNKKTPSKSYHTAKDYANRRKINQKRVYKNNKYGHGGQKKRQKRNTSESVHLGARNDFSQLKHQATPNKAKQIRLDNRKFRQKRKKMMKRRS
ncbi:putative rRNA-processing protein EBP2 [Schistosoma japonicum]|nr:putative rRNA-processing protein EBP2 [Schistosoma japonicum]KAH8856128.1 putative rRNA-processing protein EBP2 [Schistosoma japonicum]